MRFDDIEGVVEICTELEKFLDEISIVVSYINDISWIAFKCNVQ